MISWRYEADNAALRTAAGVKEESRIKVTAESGCALFGPYVDIPAGRVEARVVLEGPCAGSADIELTARSGAAMLASKTVKLDEVDGAVSIAAVLPSDMAGCEVRVFSREPVELQIRAVEIDLIRDPPSEPLDPERRVGFETRKTYRDKIDSGFVRRFLSGPAVLEIGYKGYYDETVPVVPQAIGVDIGYPGYDGIRLPFASGSFDAIYSSHCLEHVEDYQAVIGDWYRLLKVGGHLVIAVPHQYLFERKRFLPSLGNDDHKRFYTAKSLLDEIEQSLSENSYRVRYLRENDEDFDYDRPPSSPSSGQYEIEVVIQKIRKPYWNLIDGTIRPYAAGEFLTNSPRPDPWLIAVDMSAAEGCVIYGPYVILAPGEYVAKFCFEFVGRRDGDPLPDMVFDVAFNAGRVASSYAVRNDAGADMLREGAVSIPFTVSSASANVTEFRIHAAGGSPGTTLLFRGVVLAYAADARPMPQDARPMPQDALVPV